MLLSHIQELVTVVHNGRGIRAGLPPTYIRGASVGAPQSPPHIQINNVRTTNILISTSKE